MTNKFIISTYSYIGIIPQVIFGTASIWIVFKKKKEFQSLFIKNYIMLMGIFLQTILLAAEVVLNKDYKDIAYMLNIFIALIIFTFLIISNILSNANRIG